MSREAASAKSSRLLADGRSARAAASKSTIAHPPFSGRAAAEIEAPALAFVADRSGSSLLAGLATTPANLTRTRYALQGLQRTHGNAHVQRVVERAAARSKPKLELARVLGPGSIQRYPVGVRPSASCDTVLDWMQTSNPYAAQGNVALTTARFRWSGGFNVVGTAPDFTVTLTNPAVSLNKSVDMPVWSPSAEAMQGAWGSMITQLRAHEARHEAIADRWRATLLARLTALSLSVSAASERAARTEANRLVNEQWAGWLAEHQADQDAIDPYAAPLNCPGETATSESAEPPDVQAARADMFASRTIQRPKFTD
jgi:hypothetical protein